MAAVRSGKQLGGWYHLAVGLLRPGMVAITRRDWRGTEHLRAGVRADGTQEGIVVCTNHISWFDPLECAHFLYDNGRPPRFLGKESVFRIPLVGRLISGAGQIPVYRETADAAAAIRSALAALEAGECVVVYPEGTITRDPEIWPMSGKTGAVRMALLSGKPLVPMAQWGSHLVIGPYRKEFRVFPRKTMHIRFGSPLDLSDLTQVDGESLTIATERLMDAITALVADARGEQPPARRYEYGRHRTASDHDEPRSGDGRRETT